MVQEISKGDIDQCVMVIRKSFRTVADEFGFTEENAARFTVFATTKERLDWQMNHERCLMYGYYSLLLQDNQECVLNNLCVLPAYRHKKLGHELLEDAFDNARKRNCKKMNIGIVEENQKL